MLKKQHILHTVALIFFLEALAFPISLSAQSVGYINPSGKTVETRFILPKGYERIPADKNSYTYFLRHLYLFPDGTVSGDNPPMGHSAGILNVDMAAIDRVQHDAQMCLCLRGEYLFEQEQYDKIAFTIITFEYIPYVEWVEGMLLVIKDKTYITKSYTSIERYRTFRNYLGFITTNADVFTLLVDVQPISINDIMPGDMFIQATRPGRVVVVLDVAYNPTTGDRIFLLARNCTPIRTAYVLVNPEGWSGSPWYSVKTEGNKIITPEYVFYKRDLRRFREIRTKN